MQWASNVTEIQGMVMEKSSKKLGEMHETDEALFKEPETFLHM